MSEAEKAAEKYQSDWHHCRFAYSKDYTPKSAFLAGAAWQRERDLEIIETQRFTHGSPHKLQADIAEIIRAQDDKQD